MTVNDTKLRALGYIRAEDPGEGNQMRYTRQGKAITWDIEITGVGVFCYQKFRGFEDSERSITGLSYAELRAVAELLESMRVTYEV